MTQGTLIKVREALKLYGDWEEYYKSSGVNCPAQKALKELDDLIERVPDLKVIEQLDVLIQDKSTAPADRDVYKCAKLLSESVKDEK